MFNSKSYYTEEDAILANVEADLSYDGADGLCRAIIESYENERLVDELMNRADVAESRMLSESASEEDIQSLQEASVKSVVQYIIGIMQRFWAKLKGMFMRFIHKIQLWWTKRKIVKGMKDIEKTNKRMSGKVADYKEKKSSSESKHLFMYKDGMEINNINLDLSGSKLFNDFIEDTASFTSNKRDNDGKEVSAKNIDSDEELANAMVANIFKSGVSYDSLKDDLTEKFFIDDDKDLSGSNYEAVKAQLDKAKEITSQLKKQLSTGEKYSKKICSMANKAKASDNAYYLKALNRAIRIANNVIFRVTNVVFGLNIKALNSMYSFYKACVSAQVTITLK